MDRAREVASWDACFHRESHLAETTHTGAVEGCHRRHSVRIESFFPAFLHKHHTGVLCKVSLKELAFDSDTRKTSRAHQLTHSLTPFISLPFFLQPESARRGVHLPSSFPLITYCLSKEIGPSKGSCNL